MPRFHFEIVDGYTLPDPSGMELPTDEAAKKVVREIAKQISIDSDDPGLTDVVVKNGTARKSTRRQSSPH